MRQIIDEVTAIYVHSDPIDMRKSYDGLYRLVKKQGIFNGGVFLFISKNRKRAKALLWNKKGLMIIMQRMENGRFCDIGRRSSITREEFLQFFEGNPAIRKIDGRTKKSLDSRRQASDPLRHEHHHQTRHH